VLARRLPGNDQTSRSGNQPGLLALLLLILNVLVLALAYAAIPDKSGVDSGLGFGFLIIFFSFPLALFAIFLGILSLIWKQGRIPGTIALVVAGGAVLFIVYGFFETQVF